MLLPVKLSIDSGTRLNMNTVLLIVIGVIFVLEVGLNFNLAPYILQSLNYTLVTYGFIHLGWWHVMGNLFFLWLFGNSVNQRIGNVPYFLSFLFLLVFSGFLHLWLTRAPTAGASGAVYGVMGLSFMFFPRTDIEFRWLLPRLYQKPRYLQAYWMIVAWVLVDILNSFQSQPSTAVFAHMGGLLGGLLLGLLLLKLPFLKAQQKD